MLSTNAIYLNMNDSLARSIKAKVEHYRSDGSTLIETYNYNDHIQNIHVDRVAAAGKFFGFGVAQQLTLKLADKNKEILVSEGQKFRIYFSVNDSAYLRVGPTFAVDSVKRDEKTNGLTITASDYLKKASEWTYDIIDTKTEQTAEYILSRIASSLNLNLSANTSSWGSLKSLKGIPNYSGSETFRDVLDDIAEAVQAIYFIDGSTLYMKEIRPNDAVALTIKKNHYFELTSEALHVLGGIAHVTELGDNLEVGSGIIQVVRNNAFWETYGDISDLLEESELRTRLLAITPFNCSWRGNFALQIGDKIAIRDKKGNNISTYVLNDSYEYNGGFKQTCSWAYEAEKVESTNPVTIGEKVNQTSAKVDKVAQEITMVAGKADANSEQIAQLNISTSEIRASVSDTNKTVADSVDILNGNIETLTKRVESSMTSEQVKFAIQSELSDGVNKVITETGVVVDDLGLRVEKTNAETHTQITENGMEVIRTQGNQPLLVANKDGVQAEDLEATTYLLVGGSRFESYGSDRTGCFWIGGN